jgi:V-type H+-transporting ATPase subunit a
MILHFLILSVQNICVSFFIVGYIILLFPLYNTILYYTIYISPLPVTDLPTGGDPSSDIGAPLLESVAHTVAEPKSVQLGFVAGTIQVEKLAAFERLLFRATRGNMFLRSVAVGAVSDPVSGERQEKAVYVAFFAGERAKQKILKICEAFGANRYPFPDDITRQRQMSGEVNSRLRELHTTLEAGERLRENALRGAAAELEVWTRRVKREKGIYHTLNKLSVDVTRKVLMAEAWVPCAERRRVQEALQTAAARANSLVGTVFQPVITYEAPPTYFRTSKYTAAFQDIVDAYGIARYREANPAVFSIITFPFLFAVMFGDIGHGILMLMAAGYLVAAEKKLGKKDLGDILGMMFGGRYVILLMGIFSIYTGFIYNEFFSIVTTIFGPSKFACATDASITNPDDMKMDHTLCPSALTSGLAMTSPGRSYPFGVDPAWHGTRTELPYLNSLKMKMSIVFGITQMNLGILMSYFNQKYFADPLSTICEFVPQVIFLNCLFGYLAFLILLKWATGSTADLYHTMIYMFLSPGDVDCAGACPENKMFAGQGFLQVMLLLIAVVAMPWMLFPKPYILKKRHEQRQQSRSASYGLLAPDDVEFRGGIAAVDSGSNTPTYGGGGGGGGHAMRPPATAASSTVGGGDHSHIEEFDFGEVFVHQMIHAIEFILGAVSNTASYLRLWALSLAHSQLSAVFYDRVLMAGVQTRKPGAIFIGFYLFAGATFGVLMVMESLSAFLHALRLHWVEFQNKFFGGTGYAFAPFSFKTIDSES